MQPEDLQPGEERTSDFRAAEYVRMSTEHQQYSTQNQADKIREYAARRGIKVIRTYADAGKSGLRIDGREALQRLLRDVESGQADFNVILVYDVMPAIALIPTAHLAPEALHATFVRAFADYLIGPFNLALDQWPGFLLRQGVDLSLGRAAVSAEDGSVLAFALVAPRPALGRWRLGTMGAVPEARGSGAAVQLLQDFIQRCREAGLKALELEVFVQNERAARLYRRHGFVERHALHGWQRMADAGEARTPSPELACTQDEALAWLREAEAAITDLPLQVCADVVRVLTMPWTAWRRGSAQLVFTGDVETGVIVRSLIDRNPAQQDAQSLVQALLAAHPGAKVSVPALQRSDLGGEALQRCGFAVEPLHQALMRLDLAPALP